MATTEIQTLNQVVEGLRRIAAAHQQINGNFGFGQIYDFATSGTTEFPFMWADLSEVRRKRNETHLIFDLYFMDLIRRDKSNEQEVWSDQILIAEDFLAEAENNGSGANKWSWSFQTANPDVKFTVFTEGDTKTDQWIAGVVAQVNVIIRKPLDRCAIPQGSITRY